MRERKRPELACLLHPILCCPSPWPAVARRPSLSTGRSLTPQLQTVRNKSLLLLNHPVCGFVIASQNALRQVPKRKSNSESGWALQILLKTAREAEEKFVGYNTHHFTASFLIICLCSNLYSWHSIFALSIVDLKTKIIIDLITFGRDQPLRASELNSKKKMAQRR